MKRDVIKFHFKRCTKFFKKVPNNIIFHASVQKSGSQWLKAVFNDPEIRQLTNLTTYPQHRYEWNEFKGRFPNKSFVPGLYISYQLYEEIEKPDRYFTLYILRDPRDLVVSWYYSMKYSHGLMGKVHKHRANLNELNEDDGITYCIDHFHLKLSFMKDWVLNCNDPNVVFLKFEDLVKNPSEILYKVFMENGYDIEKEKLSTILANYTKDAMRSKELAVKGQKDSDKSHYRKNSSKWQDVFSDNHIEYFNKVNGDIVKILGYD